VLLLVVAGLIGPVVAPFDPTQQSLRSSLQAPQGLGGRYLLGTDSLGRDMFSRILHGARVSLIIGLVVVVMSGFIGLVLGTISGYYGGRVDFAIQKLVEVVWAFPALLLAIVLLTFLGQSLPNLVMALAAQRWISYSRLARGQVLSLRHREFVLAARVIGAGTPRILRMHIVPNIVAAIVVVATFSMASAIIAEASLSFLGLGVPASIPTWGGMLADGRSYVVSAPWLAIFPGLAIFATALGINLLGDSLRDLVDPRLQGRD
jgi:peptide/nickel transport system permease protein